MSSERCPHCRTTVGVTPTRRGGVRCKLCGGPRVIIHDSRIVLSGREVPDLVEARRKGLRVWVWWGTTLLLAMIGAFFLLVATGTVLLAGLPTTTSVLLMLFGCLPWVAALLTWRRGRRARQDADAALHAAGLSAARDVLASSERELTAHDMARLLGFSLPATERLLMELNVDDAVMSQVTDAGDVTYRLAPLRVRIEQAYLQSRSAPADAEGGELPKVQPHQDPPAPPQRTPRGTGDG